MLSLHQQRIFPIEYNDKMIVVYFEENPNSRSPMFYLKGVQEYSADEAEVIFSEIELDGFRWVVGLTKPYMEENGYDDEFIANMYQLARAVYLGEEIPSQLIEFVDLLPGDEIDILVEARRDLENILSEVNVVVSIDYETRPLVARLRPGNVGSIERLEHHIRQDRFLDPRLRLEKIPLYDPISVTREHEGSISPEGI